MANSPAHNPHRPRRVRARSERAMGLEPEVTAQPHPLSEELGLVIHDEGALSIAPEDLGTHFLSEAVQHGDLAARDLSDLQQALMDAELESEDVPRTDADFEAWARMVERAARNIDISELREVAAEGNERLESERVPAPRDSVPSDPVRLDESIVREVSLLDREGAALDETVAPIVDIDDTGRHARVSHRGALGEQVGDGGVRRAAEGGKRMGRAAKQKLGQAAGKIRNIARKIARR